MHVMIAFGELGLLLGLEQYTHRCQLIYHIHGLNLSFSPSLNFFHCY